MEREPLRFADILTNASAIANYLGSADVRAAHMLEAIALLSGEKTMEELGRPVSPLVSRGARGGGVDPDVREIVQRWFARLGGDANATLAGDDLAAFGAELAALPPGA